MNEREPLTQPRTEDLIKNLQVLGNTLLCGKVQVIDVCVVDALERIARQMGYSDVTHTLELFGVCLECQAAASGGADVSATK